MKQSAKEQIINNFNIFLQEEIIPNKLQINMNHEQSIAIDFDNLKLIDVYFGQTATCSNSDGYNEYTTIVHVIVLGDKTAILEIDINNELGGLYPLNNYRIFYGTSCGTSVEATYDVDNFEDYGLHLALNEFNYEDMISDEDLKYNFETEETENKVENLKDAKFCFPGLDKIEPISLEESRLYFNTGIDIVVLNNEIVRAINKYNSLEN